MSDYGNYTPPPDTVPPPLDTPPPPKTVVSTSSKLQGNNVVTTTTYSDGSTSTSTRAATPGELGTLPGAAPPPATTPATTPAAPADPNAPPAGADPNEEERVFENGRVIKVVYKYTANGHTKGDVIKDYSGIWAKLDSVSQAPDFNTWLQQQGYGGNFTGDITKSSPYQGMTDLIAKLQDPNTPIADRQAAQEQIAKERGYASAADMQAAYNQWQTNLQGGPANQVGMTDAEKLAFQRVSAGQTQDLETQQRKQLDAILSGQTGNSTARALMQANENIKTIRDTQLQSTVSLMNMDYSRKLDAFDRNAQLYKDAMDRGEMTTQQFMQAFKDNRMAALQGFAQQTSTILTQNQQYLNMYGADLEKIKTNADIVYQQIQTELGIDEAAATAIRDSYDQWAAQEGLRLTKAQLEANNNEGIFKDILSFIGTVLGFIF